MADNNKGGSGMRTVLTGGHLLPKNPARKCFVCDGYFTLRDERLANLGSAVSHGVCSDECLTKWEREYREPMGAA